MNVSPIYSAKLRVLGQSGNAQRKKRNDRCCLDKKLFWVLLKLAYDEKNRYFYIVDIYWGFSSQQTIGLFSINQLTTKKAIEVLTKAIEEIEDKDFLKTIIILSANLKVIENHIIHEDLGRNEIAILTNKLNLKLLNLASNVNEAIKSKV